MLFLLKTNLLNSSDITKLSVLSFSASTPLSAGIPSSFSHCPHYHAHLRLWVSQTLCIHNLQPGRPDSKLHIYICTRTCLSSLENQWWGGVHSRCHRDTLGIKGGHAPGIADMQSTLSSLRYLLPSTVFPI